MIARQKTADAYNATLKDVVKVPHVIDGATSAWAQYTVLLPEHVDRSKLMTALKEAGIPTMVYYVKPLHLQTAYKHYPTATGSALPICEKLSERVLSLPMSGYVGGEEALTVINAIKGMVQI